MRPVCPVTLAGWMGICGGWDDVAGARARRRGGRAGARAARVRHGRERAAARGHGERNGRRGALPRRAGRDGRCRWSPPSAAAPQTRNAHVPEPAALAAGLACAGGATLLGHPLPAAAAEALGAALERGTPAALVATLDGAATLVLTGPDLAEVIGGLGSAELDGGHRRAARARLRRGATVTERTDEFLLDLWVPVPSVLIVGSGAIGAALAAKPRCWGGPRGP